MGVRDAGQGCAAGVGRGFVGFGLSTPQGR